MYQEGPKKDETYAKGIFIRETIQLIGIITLSGIVRDVIQSAWLAADLIKNKMEKATQLKQFRSCLMKHIKYLAFRDRGRCSAA